MTSPRSYLRTLFLHPPSYEGFDGGAGSRYQAKREIRSFWYPTWLAQPAALVPGSRLIDAPPEGLTLDDVRPVAREYDLAVLHTSTPSFSHDVRVAEALKLENPELRIGFVGAHVAVDPERALSASRSVDFVARNEFDFTIAEVAQGKPLATVAGVSFRDDGGVRHTPDRVVLENMDELPFVVDVYKRDLTIEHYAIGYLLHPYVSLYTGRGCRSKCTFCLWPQTVGGHRYRTRSVDHVAEEIAVGKRHFPNVREFFFDDDTLTDDLPRAAALAERLGRLGVTWSCNAKANVPYETLAAMKDNGLRLLLVGYESGNQTILNNVKKGVRLDTARRFTRDARALGIKIHGTFILGLPGETRETMEATIRFAKEIDPDTIQVSIAAPYPGTELYRQAVANGWLTGGTLVDDRGAQVSALSYPHLMSSEIATGTEEFYRRFYFRPKKIYSIAKEMLGDGDVMRRRLREGREFLQFLAARSAETARTGRVQVVLPVTESLPTVAGIPAVVRTAHELATLPAIRRVVITTESPEILDAWRRQLAGIPATVVAGPPGHHLNPALPVVVLAPDGMPARNALADFVTRAEQNHDAPTTWMREGRSIAAYHPTAQSLNGAARPGAPNGAHGASVEAPAYAWQSVGDPPSARRAARRLFASLRQPSDGYLARLDRTLSIALSRALIHTPITPNIITAVSLMIGLGGAAMLASVDHWTAVAGALALWISCILDGCDGEVARLTLQSSRLGARLDVAADNVVHVATFLAIAVHVARAQADMALFTPTLLLLSGVILSMASVWWFINRHPMEQRLGFKRIYERIASRDYVYVLVALTLAERLEWFVWAAALGANAFWVSLWAWAGWRRAR
ncbi:MAG: hopanoid biosynthesis associated radical SAM protein HpnJ [Candidatus Rokubacteria bacterium]|nr:hopanoid biosynthesis associated radical SAM protein HpnJ [Candidatus Rokubacteria bacterium]